MHEAARRLHDRDRVVAGVLGLRTALAAEAVHRVWELGGVVFHVGGNVHEVTPPLVITDDEVDRAVELLAQGIEAAAAGEVEDARVAAFAGW